MAGHGRTNSERQSFLPDAEERASIGESTASMAAQEGKAPRGWLSPWIGESDATSNPLTEAGYRYTLNWCSDDQPIGHATGHGPLMAIPCLQEVDDIPAVVARKDGAAQFAEMIVDDLEERLRQFRDGVAQALGMALHPYIIGQPYRTRALRRALAHMAARHDALWFTTAGGVFDHAAALPPGSISGGSLRR
jgi:hypothetical protein